jgi:hypothetical protein
VAPPAATTEIPAWDTSDSPPAADQPRAAESSPAPPAGKAKRAAFTFPRFKKDPWGGVVVSGLGGAIITLGATLAVTALTLAVAPVPFPGGAPERQGAATSAVIGTVFCSLVGTTLVAVGAVLVGVSFF